MAKYFPEGDKSSSFTVYGMPWLKRWCKCLSSAATTLRAKTS